ncbi:MAG: tRNA dihydrouridine(20/20a) synthase DusA, partial [Gemmobacter sp.]
AITRHMLGLFHGRPGARTWRRLLSEGASGGLAAYDAALDAVGATPEAAGAHGAGQGA